MNKKLKTPKKSSSFREWLPSFAELIDRLSIHQLKEVFIADYKEKYRKEMKIISNDLTKIIKEKDIQLTGEMIRSIIILAQINTHIWYNESKARKGDGQNTELLRLTHGLNGIRSSTGNYILNLIKELDRQDYKVDCLAAEFSEWDVMINLEDLGDLDDKK